MVVISFGVYYKVLRYTLYSTTILNLLLFLFVMFGDPGVPSKIYNHYTTKEFNEEPDPNSKDHSELELLI